MGLKMVAWLLPVRTVSARGMLESSSWDIFKGIKISLLVHTWYFMVGLIAFAMEIFLANKIVSWRFKSALTTCTRCALQLPQAGLKGISGKTDLWTQ